MKHGLMMHSGAVSRLRAFNETVKPEDRDDEDLVVPENWPERGEIELKGICASYKYVNRVLLQTWKSNHCAARRWPKIKNLIWPSKTSI